MAKDEKNGRSDINNNDALKSRNKGLFGSLFGKKNNDQTAEITNNNELNKITEEENRTDGNSDTAKFNELSADPIIDGESTEKLSDEDFETLLSDFISDPNTAFDEGNAEADIVETVISDLTAEENNSADSTSDNNAENSTAVKKSSDDENNIVDIVGANTDIFDDTVYEDKAGKNEAVESKQESTEGTPEEGDLQEAVPEAESKTESEAEAENKTESEKLDDTDIDLMQALGYNTDGDPAQTAKQSRNELLKHTELRADYDCAFAYRGEEYQGREQDLTINKAYSSDKALMFLRLCGIGLLTVLIFIFEIFGAKLGGVFSISDYPSVHIWTSLQLLVLAAALSWKQLFTGIAGIFKFEPTQHSPMAVAVIFTVIYDAVLAFAAPEQFSLYNFPAVLCIVISAVYDYLDINRQANTFKSLTSFESYCTLEKADPAKLAAALGESSSAGKEDASIKNAMRLRRGSFVSNYFRRTNRKNPTLKVLNYVIAPVTAISTVVFLISLAAARGFIPSLNTFAAMMLISLPASSIITLIYPFCDLSKNVLKPSELLLNSEDAEDFSGTDAIVVDEEDIFASRAILIKRIGLGGGTFANDVFDTLEGAAEIFEKSGGVLAGAFKRATEGTDMGEESIGSQNAEIDRICEGGIVAHTSRRNYLIGSNSFLCQNGISVITDSEDASFISNAGNAILYIAADGNIAFKLYLTYLADENFKDIISEFAKNNIRPIVESNDPSINSSLLDGLLKDNGINCPIRVIHRGSLDTDKTEASKNELDSGLIANGENWSDIVSALSPCRRLCKASALNLRIFLGLSVVSVLASTFLGALGILTGVNSIYIAIYQIICLMPAVISSKLLIN